jgi:probable phosphoglycerate mutase
MTIPPLVVLVRHAESDHHIRGLTGGWTQTPLTALGHEQSRRVADRLKSELGDIPIRLYTSDLLRCHETAGHISAAFGVEPIFDQRLREHNNGEAVNLTMAEATVHFPGVFGSPWAADFRPFPGSETGREFYERVAGFLDTFDGDGPLPVVVSHGGTIIRLVARWIRLPVESLETAGFAIGTTSITVLQSGGHDGRIVERLNDTAHLAGMEGRVTLGGLRR